MFDPRQFRNALGRFATGVTVVTVHEPDGPHGMTANAFTSVSLDPPLILVSVDNRARMHKLLPEAGRFGVSILADHQEAASNHYAGRPASGWKTGFFERLGVPLIEGALAFFVCGIAYIHGAGDHTLYVGRVEHFEAFDGDPLLFYAGRYRRVRAEKIAPPQWPEDEFSLFSIGNIDPQVR